VKVEFRSSFVRDLKSIRDKALLERVKEIIESAEQVNSLAEISNLKKLKGSGKYSRIRVGNYRIGIVFQGESVIFVRFLHRKDIYKYFP
jgi:mRNA interferase RelE/StbE